MFVPITKFVKRITPAHDAGFCLKVSVAQSVAFLYSALVPLTIDPQLANHVKYGARQYSLWAYVLAPVLAVVTLVMTMWLLTRIRPHLRIWYATLPSWVFSLPLFWFLRQEFPHGFLIGNLAFAAILTTIAFWIHDHSIEAGYLDLPQIATEAKLARVKEEIALWRGSILAALGGYLAILVNWHTCNVTMDTTVTTAPGEQFLLHRASGTSVMLFSFWFFVGIVAETVRKAGKAVRLLERIQVPASPEPGAGSDKGA